MSHSNDGNKEAPDPDIPPGSGVNPFRQKLAADFQNREYRESYAEESVKTSVAAQLHSLRKQRDMSQGDLAQAIGSAQSAISRMENVTNSVWNVKTLMKTAFALGTRLKISFETFSSLIEEQEAFSRQSLLRPAFEDDTAIRAWLRPPAPSSIEKLEQAG